MKNIITSNGQFNVTNALYESIKKNNPELLEAMNIPSKNMLAIAKIYKDVTGNDIDKSNESEILSLYIKHGSDINEFEKALKKDQEKKDNINNKNIENKENQNNIDFKNNKLIKKKTNDSNTDEVKLISQDEYIRNKKSSNNKNYKLEELKNEFKLTFNALNSITTDTKKYTSDEQIINKLLNYQNDIKEKISQIENIDNKKDGDQINEFRQWYDDFKTDCIKFLEERGNKTISNRIFGSGTFNDVEFKNEYKNILYNSYITNDTINFINKLYKNTNDDDGRKKILKRIIDEFNRDVGLENNFNGKSEN